MSDETETKTVDERMADYRTEEQVKNLTHQSPSYDTWKREGNLVQQRQWLNYTDENDNRIRNLTTLNGKVSLATLLELLPAGVEPNEIYLYFGGSIEWLDESTPDEEEERRQRRAVAAQHSEEWERKTLARLREKYED